VAAGTGFRLDFNYFLVRFDLAFRFKRPIAFNNMVEEYYRIIGNNLTDMQRDNFLAFSQHHGIPTNLIDFSYSPLISLFFSCYGSNSDTVNRGYVYFIDKKKDY
jgi:hypothetical protein